MFDLLGKKPAADTPPAQKTESTALGAKDAAGFNAGSTQQAPHADIATQHQTDPKASPDKKGKKTQAAQKPGQSKAYTALKDGSVSVVDLISPSSVEVDFKNVRVGDKFFRTFFVVDYP